MINVFYPKKHISFILVCFIIKLLFTAQMYETYNITIPFNDTHLDMLYIHDNYSSENKVICEKWIPSLMTPILLTHPEIEYKTLKDKNEDITIETPIINELIIVHLYLYDLFGKYEVFLGRIKTTQEVTQCYFGLSSGFGNFSLKSDEYINLNYLVNNTYYKQKVFSVDSWTLNNNSKELNTALYFGDVHEKFNNSDNGIIGTCNSDKDAPFWGCEFKKIGFNDIVEELKKDNISFYKIYFSSENHEIVIPRTFKKKFEDMTKCEEDNKSKEVSCNNIFNQDDYFQIKLIDDKMIITIEVDNLDRYINKNKTKKTKTRIVYKDYDFFILPLIMFKNFQVQFDANNYNISFFTTDEKILQIIKNEKPKKKNDSNVGTVFLVIFIIILFLALGFGLFWFINKKRRNSLEKNINKYNKFEDEENFQDMNEKRVF